MAWASHLPQKEQVDAEHFGLVQEPGVEAGGRSPGSGTTGCVLVVAVVTLRVSRC